MRDLPPGPSTFPPPDTPAPRRNTFPPRKHPWTFELIESLPPGDRPPSPHPLDTAFLNPSGWDSSFPLGMSDWADSDWDDGHRLFGWASSAVPRPVPVWDRVWSYDADVASTNWIKADGVGAAYMFNAAYDHALQWADTVPRLNMSWHREDEFNIFMYGRGPQRHIAPDQVHAAMDDIFAVCLHVPTFTELELRGLHAQLDLVWLRHSRAPPRVQMALLQLQIFHPEEIVRMAAVMREHCLVDFREVMLCVDPRAAVVYGRTKNGEGISRRWRNLGHDRPPPHTVPRHAGNEDSGDDDDALSVLSGSSRDTPNVQYTLGRWERAEQLHRFCGRRVDRARVEARKMEELARSQEAKLQELLKRADAGRVMLDVVGRGLRARSDSKERREREEAAAAGWYDHPVSSGWDDQAAASSGSHEQADEPDEGAQSDS